MPVDMLSMNAQSALNTDQSRNVPVVNGNDVQRFQAALKSLSSPVNVDMVANNINVAAAAAESMGVGESHANRKKSMVDKISDDIEESLESGSDQLQSLYRHISKFSSADKLSHGSTMLSIQLELMRATVIIDIITKIANKAATTIDSMIRLQ
ncbi:MULTISPECIES: type III secretion system inner rod subunit SctI [Candidatus Ichthyocystis]|uniref:Uncharacterized protein n=1 Tax=Candidatus Ichthyocystis hellenicum TaxID=1561003 RepID=A0A0S4M226_9BURK|nr:MULTISPECIES: type III secretion system inner rod subunit SctI [Ichthyocystis]CUT17071.1 hypothetical protein Ark11_0214 [Candidatus Ichthyocystis hellenicum]